MPRRRVSLSERIIQRILNAEQKEPDPHNCDDYRIARITVGLAAQGDPSPHMNATLRVLGLYPEQVWPKIVERRKAQLGKHFFKFCYPDGRWRPADAESPPKKPARSVGKESGSLRQVKAAGAERGLEPKSKRRGLLSSAPPNAFIEVSRHDMSSTQTAYRKPPQSSSENAAFAQLPRIELVRRADLEGSIRELILALMSVNKLGNELYMGVERLTVEIGKVSPRSSRITRRGVFYRLAKAVQLGVLKVVVKPGTWVRTSSGKRYFRRTATYQLVPEKLPMPRLSWEEYSGRLPVADPIEPIKPHSVREFPAVTTRKPKPRDLTKVEMKYLYQEVPRLMKGVTRAPDLGGGLGAVLSASDPRYQRPLDRDTAIREACRRKDIPIESATELLASWKPKGDA